MKPPTLQAPVSSPTAGDALAEWRWLVDEHAVPLMVTALGDLFTRAPSGDVWFLDTYEGRYTRVADDERSWRSAMEASESREAWLSPELVAEIEATGLRLSAEQCFSPILPLAVGGAMAPENFECSPWLLHMSLTGQIYEQIRHLPEGTPIAGFVDASDDDRE
jgi:hypothetical protein